MVFRVGVGLQLHGSHLSFGAQQAVDHLLPAHFQTEKGHLFRLLPRLRPADSYVLGDVQGQGGLAHGRPGGQDDKIRGMHARRNVVQVQKAGGDPGKFVVPVQDGFDMGDPVGHQLPGVDKIPCAPAAGQQQDGAFRFVLQGAYILRSPVGHGGDGSAALDEAPPEGVFLHDVRVIGHVGGGGNRVGQQRDIADAARVVQLLQFFQLVDQGHHVNRLVFAVKQQHGIVNDLVGGAVEILGAQPFGHGAYGAFVDQHGAQHGLLRFNVLGWCACFRFNHLLSYYVLRCRSVARQFLFC